MKLLFDHTYGFGKMSKQNIQYVPFAAQLEPNEYKEYLEKGWYPFNQDLWYQTRSTRIDLSAYQPTKEVKRIAKKIKCYPNIRITEPKKQKLKSIYENYIQQKGYRYDLSIEDIINNSNGYIYYALDGEIIAFSFYRIIEDAFLGIEFAWDYKRPSLSMGHVNIYYAAMLAKKHRCKHFYLSSGYESCCIYKSQYPGFEWWKGYEWTDDIDLYKNLCKRDDEVKISGPDLF